MGEKCNRCDVYLTYCGRASDGLKTQHYNAAHRIPVVDDIMDFGRNNPEAAQWLIGQALNAGWNHLAPLLGATWNYFFPPRPHQG